MVAKVFLLPDLGEGLIEAEVVHWLVAVGDTVASDQPVAAVETEKAVVEIPSPFPGTVLTLHADEGAQVQVGQPLITVEVGPASTGDGPGSVLVGYGTGTGRSPRRAHHDARGSSPPSHPRAKPPVRKLAKDLGVDLADVSGSGPDGVITREDVQAAAKPVQAALSTESIPLRGARKAMAAKMSAARQQIPDASAYVDCDATRLWRLRRRLAEAHPGVRMPALAIILRACVAGLREFPSLNSSLDTERDEVVLAPHVNLGFAAATERGLVVPVIKDAHTMSLLRIAVELSRLTTLAREGTAQPSDLAGGTFTVSNYGSLGVDGGTPIVNFPEAAILGVGRIADRPWVHKGAVKPRKVVRLSVTFDHRLADGAEASGFLRLVADCVEHPTHLIAVL
ncbi:MAG: dihydrolipoamide acetyltransferase family protein [Egibacteraceae bacterium]